MTVPRKALSGHRLHGKENMKHFWFLALVGVALLLGTAAFADTVSLVNGSTVDGKIVSKGDGLLRINSAGEDFTLPLADVVSIVENDKVGEPPISNEEIDRRAKARDQELLEQTGLNMQQRAAVDELLEIFFLADEESSKNAKRALIDMAKAGTSPLRYLKLRLPDILPSKVAYLLEAMVELDPDGMRETLRQYARSASEIARAASLRLLGKLKDRPSLELMKSGLVDENADVRIAAIRGVESLAVREATPALVKSLSDTDLRVQNAARETLSTLWSEVGKPPVNFLENAGWQEFWKTKAAEVPGAWDPAALQPLVVSGTVLLMD